MLFNWSFADCTGATVGVTGVTDCCGARGLVSGVTFLFVKSLLFESDSLGIGTLGIGVAETGGDLAVKVELENVFEGPSAVVAFVVAVAAFGGCFGLCETFVGVVELLKAFVVLVVVDFLPADEESADEELLLEVLEEALVGIAVLARDLRGDRGAFRRRSADDLRSFATSSLLKAGMGACSRRPRGESGVWACNGPVGKAFFCCRRSEEGSSFLLLLGEMV